MSGEGSRAVRGELKTLKKNLDSWESEQHTTVTIRFLRQWIARAESASLKKPTAKRPPTNPVCEADERNRRALFEIGRQRTEDVGRTTPRWPPP